MHRAATALRRWEYGTELERLMNSTGSAQSTLRRPGAWTAEKLAEFKQRGGMLWKASVSLQRPRHSVDTALDWAPRYFFLREDLRRGTFAPFSRASLRPMAMACFRLFTLRPDPLFSVPFFLRCIADLTRLPAAQWLMQRPCCPQSWYITCSASERVRGVRLARLHPQRLTIFDCAV
jgi:hypothetical protein